MANIVVWWKNISHVVWGKNRFEKVLNVDIARVGFIKMKTKSSGRPARFQTSNFIGPYNLHRLLLSGLGLLFRSLPIVLLHQS